MIEINRLLTQQDVRFRSYWDDQKDQKIDVYTLAVENGATGFVRDVYRFTSGELDQLIVNLIQLKIEKERWDD